MPEPDNETVTETAMGCASCISGLVVWFIVTVTVWAVIEWALGKVFN